MPDYGGLNCPQPMFEAAACPSTTCPTTPAAIGSWSPWSDCHLSQDGMSGFRVKNRECSTRHCTQDRQMEETCTHPSTTAGKMELLKATKANKVIPQSVN